MTLKLNLKNTALICVDLQAGVFTKEGTLALVGTDEILPNVKKVLAAARSAKIPIVHFKEVHRKEMVDFGRELDGVEPVHCLESWASTDYYWELAPIEGEFAIAKRRYSCFVGTDLEILLRGLKVDTLLLIGTLTNVCVHYTAADAHQKDYHFHVIEDCCAGSDWDAHWAALTAMEYLQTGARISHRDCLAALSYSEEIAINQIS